MKRSNLWTVLSLFLFVTLIGCESKSYDTTEDTATVVDEVSEADALMAMMEENEASFTAMIDGLDEGQLTYRESSERWSIAECAEHIISTEAAFLQAIQGTLASPPMTEGRPDSTVTDEIIVNGLADRSVKFDAPPMFVPTGKYNSGADIMNAFREARAQTVTALESFDGDLRQVYSENPAFGMMDGYQWFAFVASHGNRHIKQMQQVKDHATYPSA